MITHCIYMERSRKHSREVETELVLTKNSKLDHTEFRGDGSTVLSGLFYCVNQTGFQDNVITSLSGLQKSTGGMRSGSEGPSLPLLSSCWTWGRVPDGRLPKVQICSYL
jgi:hypothetical protein